MNDPGQFHEGPVPGTGPAFPQPTPPREPLNRDVQDDPDVPWTKAFWARILADFGKRIEQDRLRREARNRKFIEQIEAALREPMPTPSPTGEVDPAMDGDDGGPTSPQGD